MLILSLESDVAFGLCIIFMELLHFSLLSPALSKTTSIKTNETTSREGLPTLTTDEALLYRSS